MNNNNYKKVYPSAPSAPILDIHAQPMVRSALDHQQSGGYVPKENNGAFAPPVIPNSNRGFPYIENQPLFHIQPYPPVNHCPPVVHHHGPPPCYSPSVDNKIPIINPHNLPGGHQVSYIQPQPSAYPKSGYVPQSGSSSVVIDHHAFDSGARFNQGARPVLPPCPPGATPTIHQIAAANGQQVILGKKKSNWFFQKGGGSVFW